MKNLVKLEKSRFFVPKENHEKAIERAITDDWTDWIVGNVPDGEIDPLIKPTPFQTIESLLERFGFETYVSKDGAVWIKDFNDREMSKFEERNMAKLLMAFSFDVEDAIIEYSIKGYDYNIVIKNGKGINTKQDFYFDINDYKLKRTPFLK